MPRQMTQHKKASLTAFAQDVISCYSHAQIYTSYLYPSNFASEFRKFQRSDMYSPRFRYRKRTLPAIPRIVDTLWKDLLNLRLPLDLESYIESLLQHMTHLHDAQRAIGSSQFGDYAAQVFPVSSEVTKNLHATLPVPDFADSTGASILTAYEIQQRARDYIEQSGYLDDVSVVVDTQNPHTIRAQFDTLVIGSRVRRNEQNVMRLIVHEIESHILQKQNILANNPALRLRTQYDREKYAEGIALYNEIVTGSITESAYDLYQHRLQAVSMIHLSFRELYEHLAQHMSDDKAYITTYRVKRGMSDTTQPGGWPKDAVYLLGYKAVTDYLYAGGRIEMLYLSQVPELGELLLKYDLLPHYRFHMPEFLKN